ncbi:DNA-binding response OmpR family regulator [Bradyrhizobium sp. LB7.2]
MQAQASADDPIVLIVDDDPSMRRALTNLFQSVGLRVEAFGSAAEVMEAKPPVVPSCLVLDIRLPGSSGFDLQTDLAKANIRTPIIFITGHGDIPMTVRAMKSGAIDFLTKPVRDQDMLDAVQAAIDRDRRRRNAEKSVRRSAVPFRGSDRAPARHPRPGCVRPDEQASRRRAWIGRDYRQDLSRTDHAENGRQVIGRSRQNDRGARNPTPRGKRANLSMLFKLATRAQFPVGAAP